MDNTVMDNKVINNKSRLKVFTALAVPLLLFVTACFGGGTSVKGQDLRLQDAEPRTAILPGMVNDQGGSNMAKRIFAGLVTYDEEGRLVNEVAESIKTEDDQNFTIKLKRDWKFTNGEKVTAKSFVDAWNFAANISNAQSQRGQFRYFDGYSEDLKGDLSGLKIVDDYTFTVKLKTKVNDFADRLDHTAFFPLPSVAYKDIKKFGKNPIGNGRFILTSRHPNREWTYKPNPDYHGYRSKFPTPPRIIVKVYQGGTASYSDYMAGELDYTYVPQNALLSYKEDSKGRFITGAGNSINYINIPVDTPGFEVKTEAGKLRRKALSLAINRKEIVDRIFHGAYNPAETFFPAAYFPQYVNLPGSDVFKYNPEKAKELWAEAEKLSPYPKGKVDFVYNVDGDHKPWIEAVVNQLKNNLGITNIVPKPVPTFKEFLNTVYAKGFKGFARYGWALDGYILSINLEQVFTTGADDNPSRYSNPEVDKLAAEAVQVDASKAEEIYKKIFTILMDDLPIIPFLAGVAIRVYSQGVEGIEKNKAGIIYDFGIIRK